MTGKQLWDIHNAALTSHGESKHVREFDRLDERSIEVLTTTAKLVTEHIKAEVEAGLIAYIQDRRKKENPL